MADGVGFPDPAVMAGWRARAGTKWFYRWDRGDCGGGPVPVRCDDPATIGGQGEKRMGFAEEIGKFRRGNAAPLYLQLQQVIRDGIGGGKLQQGDAIPAERDLAVEYDVSRTFQ